MPMWRDQAESSFTDQSTLEEANDSTERRAGLWSDLFSWTGIFMVGWLIYELTTDASLSVVVLCLKFGWEDFKTGLWLRRRDPDTARGRTCFWIFLAWSLAKVAIAGAVSGCVIMVLIFGSQQNGQPRSILNLLVEAFLSMLIGFVLSALATLVALARAWRLGHKIWVDRVVTESRLVDWWPPTSQAFRRVNRTGRLVFNAFVHVYFMILVPGFYLLVDMIIQNRQMAAVITCVATLIFLPFGILSSRDFARKRLLANEPAECWNTLAAPGRAAHGDYSDFV